ncbi:HAMP domain-containing histidine kinase [Paenibacillus sp. HN-1]|uniref:sensor histidine kinase n=1 Tax=Paenibacillus TaxID=44249 RepID=UPI001CA7E501|nr:MULTISPECIES: HAMP domain-containing sensor histidine kinase [Paenibacillus]MBY9079096.1 HAMP domain-containing histidine kinase [Paenibacillus sp. CGMCC 1.18879]MBY9086874.1 HAMP domain-containing histidine kinase [Paenibacillus sinensis]
MNRRFRIGLKGKLALLLALLLAFVLVLLSVLVLAGIRDDQQSRLEQSFAHQADAANLRVRQQFLTGEPVEPAAFMERNGQKLAVDLSEQSGMAVTLYDAEGVFAGTSLPFQPQADVKDALAYTANRQSVYITEGDQILYLAPLYNADQFLGTLQFHASLAEQHAFYRRIQNLFLGIGAAVLASGFLLGYLYVWRQVNVIGRLNEAARRIGQGRYLSEPTVRRRDELGELAQGIYEMSGSVESSVNLLTEEKQKLLAAIVRLQELEQQQKQFIGNISHELKTPLTSIMAYADLLEMYQDDPALLGEARMQIRRDAERLYGLVEKALQLSSMDIYDFETHAETVQLKPLLEEAVSRLEGKAASRRISLVPRLTEGTVWADPEHIMHMLLNLLDNAVKYNRPGGSVTVSNMPEDGPEGEARMKIEVADTGIGIPESAKERIFDPFYTVSADRSRETGGSGLGLPLVRSLADKQNGSVYLAETGPEGSRFVLTLPAGKPDVQQGKRDMRQGKPGAEEVREDARPDH